MIIHSIYKYTNRVTGKSYIGYTKHPEKRHRDHIRNAKTARNAFYYAVRKHGWESFSYNIIFQSSDGYYCHNIMEEFFIKEYRSHVDENGYNQTEGGDGLKNPDAETRWKIGSANRGKKRGPPSEETKRKIGLANSKKRRTEEEKEHLRQVRTGTKTSESTILKHSKRYIVCTPNKEEIKVTNLFKFCKENQISQSAMSAIALGKRQYHKGWSVRFDTT